MRQMVVSKLSLPFILAVLLLPGRAEAQENRTEGLNLWDQAQEVAEQGDLAQADRRLRRSYDAWPNGLAACELGHRSQELGHRPTALYWLRICAAAEEVSEELRTQAADEVLDLENQVGTLILPAGPEGIRVLVDGEEREIREGPTEVLLLPGFHQVELVEPSGRRWRQEVRVRPGGRTRMEVPSEIEDQTTTARRRYRSLRATLWAALGTSLVLAVGTGVALGYDIALSDRGDAGADQATLASTLLGGLTGVGLAIVFTLIPYVVALRQMVRAPAAPSSSGNSGASLTLSPFVTRF